VTQRFHKQRGVVTLIGALFIIITLALMIQVLHRMAGSDILDTAVQNDSVEALFVAETGIENASFRYANGSGCPGLIGANDNAGRGGFIILNAFLVGTDCRIRVQGTVGSTGSAQAIRTVDADLRLAANEGWIVGDNGTILRWDGASWNTFTPSPTTEDLFDVHCVNATDCTAVGANGTIIHWDGGTWSSEISNVPTGFLGITHDLFAVSCEPNNPDNCYAVGGSTTNFFGFLTLTYGIIQRWDGISWSNVINQASTTTDWRFNDLSCPSATCYVVTTNGVIVRYDTGSGNWVNDVSNTAVPLNGVACTADDYCWAVGDLTGNNWSFDFRNAASWTPITVGATPQYRQNLNAVSCVDINDCWAVGNHDGSRYLLAEWNGASWTPFNFAVGAQRENLNAVHCLAGNDCWAVGDYRNGGNVINYDGVSWAYIGAAVANNTNLNGVHFPAGAGGGGGGGAVTLIRWQEFISN